jgi:hypothetical protein
VDAPTRFTRVTEFASGAQLSATPHQSPQAKCTLQGDAENDGGNPQAASISPRSSSSRSSRFSAASPTNESSAASPKLRVADLNGRPQAACSRSPPRGRKGRTSPHVPSELPIPKAATIYDKLADTFGLLVTDPAPFVAQYGKAALMACGHDLSHLPTHDNPAPSSGPSSSGMSTARTSAAGGHSMLHASNVAAMAQGDSAHVRGAPQSASSVSSQDHPAARRESWLWQSLGQRFSTTIHRLSNPHNAGGSQRGGQAGCPGGGGARSSSANTSPTCPATLSPRSHASHALHPVNTTIAPLQQAVSATFPVGAILDESASPKAGAAQPLSGTPTGNGGNATRTTHRIPSSVVYKRLCQHFRRPQTLGKKQRPEAVLTLHVSPPEWGVVDRIERKLDQQLGALEGLRERKRQCESTKKPRLNDNVQVWL